MVSLFFPVLLQGLEFTENVFLFLSLILSFSYVLLLRLRLLNAVRTYITLKIASLCRLHNSSEMIHLSDTALSNFMHFLDIFFYLCAHNYFQELFGIVLLYFLN